MELISLGFDNWFQEKQMSMQIPGCSIARVTAVDRESYLVRDESNEIPAVLAGKVVFFVESSLDIPCVGDWVFIQYYNSKSQAIIHDLFPRKTVLWRKSAGKKRERQIIAANIDSAFIVQSCDLNFNVRRLERYLVMVNEGGIKPTILLSKSDLVNGEMLEKMILEIRQYGISDRVIAFSNNSSSGINQIQNVLEVGKTYCLLGSSGVGKTSLLNHLIGREVFDTAPVREKDGKGRYTTVRRQLVVLDSGAMLVDTPGMRELGNIGVSVGLDETFKDIRELSMTCRFTNCTHTTEEGCSLMKAIEKGELNERRYRNYLKLLKESEFHLMSYFEKRKKDRKFGQFIRSAMKQHKKR